MMKFKTYVSLLTVFFLPFVFRTARAAAPDPASCFDSKTPFFLQVYLKSGMSLEKMLDNIPGACGDLTNDVIVRNNVVNTVSNISKSGIDADFIDLPTLIDTIFPGRRLKAYEKKLDVIRRVQDPIVRIKKTYDLVIHSEGTADATLNQVLHQFVPAYPDKILERAKLKGSGGNCRDFSDLLAWSLNYVSLSPRLSARHWPLMGLDENSFMVTRIRNLNHAWVEVMIPIVDGGRTFYKTLDLDSVFYDSGFTPLSPRLDRTEQERINLTYKCQAVVSCLFQLHMNRTSLDATAPQYNAVTQSGQAR